MAGNFINFKELHPFQTFIVGNKALINFGTVISFGLNNLQTTIVPNINNQPLLRVGDDDFEEKNLLDISNNGIIFLEIKFKDIEYFLDTYIIEWEEAIRGGKYDPFIGKYYPDGKLTVLRAASSKTILDDFNFRVFGPLVLDTPPIEHVNLKFEQNNQSFLDLANNENFLYIDENIKRVAIALIRTGNLIQLINSDYAVSIPFVFQKKLLVDFLADNEN